MKKIGFLIITLVCQLGLAQTVDFDIVEYNGLGFSSSKSEIEKKLGSPNKTFEPKYECGFLSSYEQGVTFYTLDFEKIKFTGTEEGKYLIEEVNFENCDTKLNYGNYNLTCETDSRELIEIFGGKTAKWLTDNFTGGIVIFHSKNDDGIRLELKNGKLTKWRYWSPC